MFFITHSEIANESTAMVEVDGPLNSETSTDFEEYTSRLAENGIINLVISSGKINFLSSEGIGAVLLLHRKLSAMNGIAVFFGLSREISLLFHLLGFDNVLNTAEDKETALDIIKTHGPAYADLHVARESRMRSVVPQNEEPAAPPARADIPAQDNHAPIRPFVIECVKCFSPVRVSMKGEHYCPYCSAPFTVSGEGNAIFRLNDVPSSGK